MGIRFEVAPYALLDVLRALENTKDNNLYVEYGVTKEDGNLIVWANEKSAKTSAQGTQQGLFERVLMSKEEAERCISENC